MMQGMMMWSKSSKVVNLLLLLRAIILHRSSGWSMMTINQTDVAFFNKQPPHNFYSTQIWQTWHSCLFLRIAFARSSFSCLLVFWELKKCSSVRHLEFHSLLCFARHPDISQLMAEEGEWRRKMSVGGKEGSLPGEEGDDYTTYVVRANLYMYYTTYVVLIVRANLHIRCTHYTTYVVRANLYSMYYTLYNLRANLYTIYYILYNLRAKLYTIYYILYNLYTMYILHTIQPTYQYQPIFYYILHTTQPTCQAAPIPLKCAPSARWQPFNWCFHSILWVTFGQKEGGFIENFEFN